MHIKISMINMWGSAMFFRLLTLHNALGSKVM